MIALVLHHLDPRTKSHNISSLTLLDPRRLANRRRMRKESDKCELVCQNCHALIHLGGDWSPEEANTAVRR